MSGFFLFGLDLGKKIWTCDLFDCMEMMLDNFAMLAYDGNSAIGNFSYRSFFFYIGLIIVSDLKILGKKLKITVLAYSNVEQQYTFIDFANVPALSS